MADKSLAAITAYWKKISKREKIIVSLTVAGVSSLLLYLYPYALQRQSVQNLRTAIASTEKGIVDVTLQIADLRVRSAAVKAGAPDAPAGWELVDQKGAVMFLSDVWGEAKRMGVSLTSVHPSQEVDKDSYKELSMNLDVKARYRELGDYFKRLESLSRVVSVRKIRVEACPDSSSVCAAQFEAVTYMAK